MDDSENRSAASLTATLLARKGEAIPARNSNIRGTAPAVASAHDVEATKSDGRKITLRGTESDERPGHLKRPVGYGDRIAMTLRLSHDDHLKLRLLSAHLSKTSQEIMHDALRSYMKDQNLEGAGSDCVCLDASSFKKKVG